MGLLGVGGLLGSRVLILKQVLKVLVLLFAFRAQILLSYLYLLPQHEQKSQSSFSKVNDLGSYFENVIVSRAFCCGILKQLTSGGI